MGIKKYNPTTPGLRGMTTSTFEEITKSTPEKSLTETLEVRLQLDTEVAATDLNIE